MKRSWSKSTIAEPRRLCKEATILPRKSHTSSVPSITPPVYFYGQTTSPSSSTSTLCDSTTSLCHDEMNNIGLCEIILNGLEEYMEQISQITFEHISDRIKRVPTAFMVLQRMITEKLGN